jgi:hypothetical protein
MPVQPSYPGVYIEEVPSGVRPLIGVPTSVTAFIGRARRGPVNDPVLIHSFADFERQFGGMWAESMMSYAVQHYYTNGGVDAVIVRVENGALPATITITPALTPLVLEAANPGQWGNDLRAVVDLDVADTSDTTAFNLFVEETVPGTTPAEVRVRESFRNVSHDPAHRRYVTTVLEQESSLVRATTVSAALPDVGTFTAAPLGDDGADVTDAEVSAAGLAATREGIWALDDADIFNLLCIPPFVRGGDVGTQTRTAALAYCRDRRAMLVLDPLAGWNTPALTIAGLASFEAEGMRHPNAALYWPRLLMPDPLKENRLEEFAPCGVVAGVVARTDAQRGVWKAPAGQEATMLGARALEYKLTDGENGSLNPLGVNCFRTFPVVGNVVWGARTMAGADRLASEWKYLPVRRLALYIEESLYRGTQWVVFEPNDEPLWSQIRANVGAFMHRLFRQGAFQGRSPREAYLVKCDAETTTQADIDAGVVNILVGFAPLKPAEFVIIRIQQLAGRAPA